MAIISLTLYGLVIKCLYSPRIAPLCGIVTVESVPPPLPIFYNIITYRPRLIAIKSRHSVIAISSIARTYNNIYVFRFPSFYP